MTPANPATPARPAPASGKSARFGASLRDNIKRVIMGKDEAIEAALCVLLSRGHLLIEDVPGVGKTYLARSLARSLNADFKRVQFTPDLLPSDLTGVSIYNRQNDAFEFRPGPVFANILLADELNRATPRTQSALLECMGEGQVSADGVTYALPDPFFVMATQNPIEQQGVYHLPEAQLDRFMAKISLGYPHPAIEAQILEKQRLQHPIETLQPVAALEQLLAAQHEIKEIHVAPALNEYIIRLVDATRVHGDLLLGASPRASLALYRLSQARAWLDGRDFVLPDTIKQMAPATMRHRMVLKPQSRLAGRTADKIIEELLRQIPPPVERTE
ncbi:MAG: MoxR family ATPase [Candidatus Sumerlaeota bacterium]|nr:MoxR family ATPase [Candidatus Sumerlaeota bacterium]